MLLATTLTMAIGRVQLTFSGRSKVMQVHYIVRSSRLVNHRFLGSGRPIGQTYLIG